MMEDETLVERQALLLDVETIEQQFGAAIGYAKQLESKVALIAHEKEEARVAADVLRAENKHLQAVLSQQHATLQRSFDHAKRCDDLCAEVRELENRLRSGEREHQEAKRLFEAQLNGARESLKQAEESRMQQALDAREEFLQKERQLRALLDEKDARIQALNRSTDDIKAEADLRARSWAEQLAQKERALEERTGELQALRKDYQDAMLLHDQQLQRARMDYEEHLLQVTARVGGSGAAGGAGQEDYWRKKLMALKQEYESKLDAARKQVEALQKKDADDRRAAVNNKTNSSPAATGRGKRRRPNQYQPLEVAHQ